MSLRGYSRPLRCPTAHRSNDLTPDGPGNKVVHQTCGQTGEISKLMRDVKPMASWITPAWQRSAINIEAKYLPLRPAFETLGCIRVEFNTDARNADRGRRWRASMPSRRAPCVTT